MSDNSYAAYQTLSIVNVEGHLLLYRVDIDIDKILTLHQMAGCHRLLVSPRTAEVVEWAWPHSETIDLLQICLDGFSIDLRLRPFSSRCRGRIVKRIVNNMLYVLSSSAAETICIYILCSNIQYLSLISQRVQHAAKPDSPHLSLVFSMLVDDDELDFNG